MKEQCEDCVCWTREGRPGNGVCHFSPLGNPVKGEGDWCIEGFRPIFKNIERPLLPVGRPTERASAAKQSTDEVSLHKKDGRKNQ